jgi:hypothetical protein
MVTSQNVENFTSVVTGFTVILILHAVELAIILELHMHFFSVSYFSSICC